MEDLFAAARPRVHGVDIIEVLVGAGDHWSPAGPMKASAPTGCGKKSMEAGGQSCLSLHYKIEHGAENRRGGVKFLLVFYGKSGYNILYARSGMPRSRDPYLEEF